MVVEKIKRRKRRSIVFSQAPIRDDLVGHVASSLAKKIRKDEFERKYAPVRAVLAFVGVGAFLAASIAIPNLPLALKPFLANNEEREAWKRFNVPYLKRTLRRLEQQKLVEIGSQDGMQFVKVTEAGKRKLLKYAIDELTIEKPKTWDGRWWLVSYDIPSNMKSLRSIFRENLMVWGFYPLHESVFLHAYPCGKQVEFLREYLGIGEYVRIFRVSVIENDSVFREFFGV